MRSFLQDHLIELYNQEEILDVKTCTYLIGKAIIPRKVKIRDLRGEPHVHLNTFDKL